MNVGIVLNGGNDVNGNSRRGLVMYDTADNRMIGAARIEYGNVDKAALEILKADPYDSHTKKFTILPDQFYISGKDLKNHMARKAQRK